MEDEKRPLVLVDSSYFSIKRATALISWWNKAHPDDPKSNHLPWVLNSVYLEKYTTLFKKNIDNLAKHYGVMPQNILFARDCPIDEIWRRKIYPGYKGSRCSEVIPPPVLTPSLTSSTSSTASASATAVTSASDPMNLEIGLTMDVSKMSSGWKGLEGQVIGLETLGYGPVVRHNNETFLRSGYVKWLRVDQAEADDVCAIIAMRVRKLQPNRQIVIVANDRDYLQLIDPKLTVVDIPNFTAITHKKGELTSGEALLHKIIAGDTSDDIPSCGTSDAKKYACNPELLKATLAKDEVFRKKFEFNSVLIDFKQIPDDIQEKIWQSFLTIAPGFATMIPPTPVLPNESKVETSRSSLPQKIKILPRPLKIIPIITRKSTATNTATNTVKVTDTTDKVTEPIV